MVKKSRRDRLYGSNNMGCVSGQRWEEREKERRGWWGGGNVKWLVIAQASFQTLRQGHPRLPLHRSSPIPLSALFSKHVGVQWICGGAPFCRLHRTTRPPGLVLTWPRPIEAVRDKRGLSENGKKNERLKSFTLFVFFVETSLFPSLPYRPL